MAYVSDSNLTQFWGLAKDYINAEDGRFANWQKTEKAGAVTCWPVGGTELLPTVDFMFTETGPAEGTKGPDNPSTITGVSSVKVTRCGKNLIKAPYYQQSGEDNGITYTVNQDGSITANGTATGLSRFYIQNAAGSIPLHKDISYVLSGCPSGGSSSTYFLRLNSFQNVQDTGSSVLITPQTDTLSGNIAIVIRDTTVSNLAFKPQLELGTTATSFEPYEGTDYTLPLGNTYYGGSIDLATGLMTVTWEGLDIGTVSMRYSSSYEVFATTDIPAYVNTGEQDCSCETFTYNSSALLSLPDGAFKYQGGNFNFKASQYNGDVSAFQSAHSGEVLVYKLATPYTVQLTPTQILSLAQTDKYTPRLNTLYTDASAVQVGYAKSPIRSEYELTQAIIATEGGE